MTPGKVEDKSTMHVLGPELLFVFLSTGRGTGNGDDGCLQYEHTSSVNARRCVSTVQQRWVMRASMHH